MDVIITAVGEFVWTVSCAVVNACLSSGVSVVAVFVSFLCAILASAFYKYTLSREQMSTDEASGSYPDQWRDNLDTNVQTTELTIEPDLTASSVLQPTIEESNNAGFIQSLSESEIHLEENPSDDETVDEEVANDILVDTIEGSEEEIQKQQIANIYRLLNDQHLINNWSTSDFLDQLKMYGLQPYDEEEELELP